MFCMQTPLLLCSLISAIVSHSFLLLNRIMQCSSSRCLLSPSRNVHSKLSLCFQQEGQVFVGCPFCFITSSNRFDHSYFIFYLSFLSFLFFRYVLSFYKRVIHVVLPWHGTCLSGPCNLTLEYCTRHVLHYAQSFDQVYWRIFLFGLCAKFSTRFCFHYWP